jgi:SAM-dependent methyltransferase
MGTAQVQGSLWGARARDYAEVVEEAFEPLYEAVFDQATVGGGTMLLDVGCGPGLAAHLAARRGARVAGLDAAEASLVVARERTPEGDFRAGDLEELPWPDETFDVVTSFNAFQFAANIGNALQQARRVTRPGGRVAMAVWGRPEDCETVVTVSAVGKLLPPSPATPAEPPLSTPGRVEGLLQQAGLFPMAGGEVECAFEFPDIETAVRGLMSAAPMVAAARRIGDEAVERTVADSLARFRTAEGGYRQRNRFRYVVATA